MANYRSNGKLLLTGEYFVLSGSTALVLPLKFGQTMSVATVEEKEPLIHWMGCQSDSCWFQMTMTKPGMAIRDTTDAIVASELQKIFRLILELSPQKFSNADSLLIRTNLEFNRNWGWGSSSTMLVNLATWAGIDPFLLWHKIYDGSGYDIAAGSITSPFLYTYHIQKPVIETVDFYPPFSSNLFFVFTGRKQKSSDQVNYYKGLVQPDAKKLERISELSRRMTGCRTLDEFNEIIVEHEMLVSEQIKMQGIVETLFSDFSGKVKSLGAWEVILCL